MDSIQFIENKFSIYLLLITKKCLSSDILQSRCYLKLLSLLLPSNPVTKIMSFLGNGSNGKETEKITGLPSSSRVK